MARRLIAEHVDSVGALDLLALLRNRPERWWTVDDISEELHCPPSWAAMQLEGLHAADVLEASGGEEHGYRFCPRDADVADAIEALADVYAARPRDVVKLIFSLRS